MRISDIIAMALMSPGFNDRSVNSCGKSQGCERLSIIRKRECYIQSLNENEDGPPDTLRTQYDVSSYIMITFGKVDGPY